jgi:hypothetical protein
MKELLTGVTDLGKPMPIAKIAQLSDGDREKWQAGHKLRRAEKREQAPALQKLELVTEEEAGFRKRIKTWFTMMRNAGAQMMGYRVMIGAELNQAKELLPHGEFTKWVESEFGLPERTQRDWRENGDGRRFGEAFQEGGGFDFGHSAQGDGGARHGGFLPGDQAAEGANASGRLPAVARGRGGFPGGEASGVGGWEGWEACDV